MARNDLYNLVEQYAALGWHRTGSRGELATIDWFVNQLEGRGCQVTTSPFSYQRWDARSQLCVDSVDIDHLAVPYSFVGSTNPTGTVSVSSIDPLFGGFSAVLDPVVAEAREQGAASVVVATEHPDGALVAINRVPAVTLDMPIALIAGREASRALDAADVRFTAEAELVPADSLTVVGRRGPTDQPPIVLSTPMTGWFACAGERGTGIAILLDLVDRLQDRPLLIAATTGHELDFLGARRWLDTDPFASIAPAAIVHVGASVAVIEPTIDGSGPLASTRMAMTSAPAGGNETMASALASANLKLTYDAERWIGEAQLLCDLDAPLLSISGAGVDFHTDSDTPDRATTPHALHVAAEAIGAAVDVLISNV